VGIVERTGTLIPSAGFKQRRRFCQLISVLGCLALRAMPVWAGDVILVSIDGLMPDYYLRADDLGLKIPNLRRLVREGSYAEGALSVMPSVTFPAHTTMITGVNPARHGIENNLVFDPDGALGGGWHWFYEDLKVSTIFDAARKYGIRTASVTWPVTAGAPIDWNLPDMYPVPNLHEAKNLRSLVADQDLRDFLPSAEKLVRMGDDIRTQVALHFLEKKPGFLAIHYLELDGAQHRDGPGSVPAKQALEKIDGYLGEVFSALQQAGRWESTSVLVVSDHGFVEVDKVVKPGVLMRAVGLLETDVEAEITAWQAAPWAAGGSLAIVTHPTASSDSRQKVLDLVNLLKSNPVYGVAKVYMGAELSRTGGFSRALAVLEARPGYFFSAEVQGELVSPSETRGMHGYSPSLPGLEAAFLAKGPGIKQGHRVETVRLLDLAPTIARILGVEFAGAQGRVLEELFR